MRRSAGRNADERGAVAVLAAFVLITIGGFLALTMNVGHMMNARAQMQAASDSAALAGAGLLDGTTTGQVNAHARAMSFAVAHKLDRDTIAVDSNLGNLGLGDIVSGYWSTARKRFYAPGEALPLSDTGDTAVTLSALTPQWFNAVRVVAAADGGGGHNSQIGVFFPGFVGATSSGVSAKTTSVALGGGPCDEDKNVLPLVVTSCAIADSNGNNRCGAPIVLNFTASGGTPPAVAFADLTPPSTVVTEEEVREQSVAANSGSSARINVLTPIATTDGSGFTDPATFTGAFSWAKCTAPGPAYTGCRRLVIPIVNTGSNCNTPMVARPSPVGFANAVITDYGTSPRQVTIVLDCDVRSSEAGGCANFGFPPALVSAGGTRAVRLVK